MERLYVNLMYVLVDEAFEITPPKDGERREMAIAPPMLESMTAKIAHDLSHMESWGMPLSCEGTVAPPIFTPAPDGDGDDDDLW